MKQSAFNMNHLQSDRVQFGKAQKTHHQEKCALKIKSQNHAHHLLPF